MSFPVIVKMQPFYSDGKLGTEIFTDWGNDRITLSRVNYKTDMSTFFLADELKQARARADLFAKRELTGHYAGDGGGRGK